MIVCFFSFHPKRLDHCKKFGSLSTWYSIELRVCSLISVHFLQQGVADELFHVLCSFVMYELLGTTDLHPSICQIVSSLWHSISFKVLFCACSCSTPFCCCQNEICCLCACGWSPELQRSSRYDTNHAKHSDLQRRIKSCNSTMVAW